MGVGFGFAQRAVLRDEDVAGKAIESLLAVPIESLVQVAGAHLRSKVGAHLYTRMVSGFESDEVEEWLGREFEAPAEEAIDRAVHDERLTPAHWKSLIRFVAAQDVRTPARLIERMAEWPNSIPPLLAEVLQGAVEKLEKASRSGVPIQSPSAP